MTKRQAKETIPPFEKQNLEGLRVEITTMISSLLVFTGAFFSWLSLPGSDFRLLHFIVFFSILIEGAVAHAFRQRKPELSTGILLLGPVLSFCLALNVIHNPAVPFFAPLIIVVNSAINPFLGLAAAGLSMTALLVFPPQTNLFLPSLLLVWLVAIATWISSRGLYTVLQWALSSQQLAHKLLEELRDHQEELNQKVTALTEATRRLQRTRNELNLARKRAEEARELKEQFAANISHELRTPLNLILGFAETMYFTPDVYGDMEWPVDLRQDIRQIYKNSKQLGDLVDDVLDLSRIDISQMPIHKERANLGSVIQEATDIIKTVLRGRELDIRCKIPAELPPLSFDQTRIRQVLINLLKNAARFTEHGYIAISAEVADEEVIVHVKDTGVGIAPNDLAKIFDEFHQVDMSIRRAKEGAGLGLAISKRFIKLHGGRIWADSEVGEGSTFHFSLPLSTRTASRNLQYLEHSLPRDDSGESSVVVIDQDPAVIKLLSRYLEGYQVLKAQDLQEAQTLVERWHPKALILNLSPREEKSYKEMTDLLPPDLPLLSCSIPSRSWISTETLVEDCLIKPISRKELEECLRRYKHIRDILIVDDDRGFVQLVNRYLTTFFDECRLRRAYDGEEALAEIRSSPPDIMILDLVMPGMDGFQLLDALRKEKKIPYIPTLVVTATDYGQELLHRRNGLITLARRRNFVGSETIDYIQAILDTTEVNYSIEFYAESRAAEIG